MKQYALGIDRFVGMKFVKQVVTRMAHIHEPLQFGPQRFNLLAIEHRHAGQITVFVKESNLIVGKFVLLPLVILAWSREEIAHSAGGKREIVDPPRQIEEHLRRRQIALCKKST